MRNEIPFEYEPRKDRMTLYPKAAKQLGCQRVTEGFLRENKAAAYIAGEDMGNWRQELKQMLTCDGQGEFELRLKINHTLEWYRIIFSGMKDEKGEIFCIAGCAVNIQESKEKREVMEAELCKDPVTGLKNSFGIRFAIENYLECKKENTCAVLVLKIDGMNRIFDTFGKAFGIVVLQGIGEMLQNTFPSADIAGRTAAEEFLIFMQQVDERTAICKAEDICNLIAKQYTGETLAEGLSASAGIAFYPQHGTGCEELYQHAKTAVAYAKRQGNGRTMYYESRMEPVEDSETDRIFPQEKEAEGTCDTDFFSSAFALLAHSQDMSSAINLLLGRLGSRFDLSSVCIFEKDRKKSRLIPTNQWESESGIRKHLKPVSCSAEESGIFRQQGVLCIEDCDNTKADVAIYQKLSRKQIKSLIVYSFEDTILGEGNIYFSDCRKKRSWSEIEKNTLRECGRMISVFVFLKKERFHDKERITELMSKDPLTGLLNRETFERKIADTIISGNEKKEAALVFADINDFEYVNSNFGMEAGNQILCDYARSLEQREGVQAGCRIYSDYFMTLCLGRSREDILENIRRSDEVFVEHQRELYPASNLYLSTGVYFFDESSRRSEPAVLIENANLARKQGKDHKNNHMEVYRESYRKEKEHEQQVAGSIHAAIRSHEVELFLQPKFSLMTRQIIGAEALARWRQKDGTLKTPVEFIPVLEKVGYIVELDFYMYEEVLKNMRRWGDEGKLLVPVSVNFSRRHIQNDDFVRQICALAQKYNIEPGLIEIEITESSITGNNQKMLEDLSRLQEQGFKVDIDDFGTGYSSLNMLLNAPVDTVKVDKSFLRNIDKSEKERRYIDQLAHLINAAEKEIIFEGVETEYQARILTECGYTMAQGYLFGKPMPAEEFDKTYMVQERWHAVSGT